MSANSDLSLRKSSDSPWTANASAGNVPLGVDVAVEGLPGREAVDELDAADLEQPVTLVRIESGGFGVEHDFAHRFVSNDLSANKRPGFGPLPHLRGRE